jgi:outer membrane protein assembly factor BamA
VKLRLFVIAFVPCIIAQSTFLSAQSPPEAQSTTRAEEIQNERAAKEATLTPDKPDKVEQRFARAQDILEAMRTGRNGFRVKLTSTAPGWDGFILGSGFSLGAEYIRPDLLNGEVVARASVVVTQKRNYLFDAQLTLPRLFGDKMIVDTLARYKSERAIDYYGPGIASELGLRTSYGKETTEGLLKTGWKLTRHLEIGAIGGAIWYNILRGNRPGVASTEQIFQPSTTPGIQEQTNYFRGGGYARLDSRNKPYLAGRGTQVEVSYAFLFLNEKRIFAVRAKTALSYHNSNNSVPFYLQQTVGGPDDLRGYPLFRFIDNNKLLLNGEYRWEVAPPVEMVVFADGGKVFPRPGLLNFSDLKGSAGIGVRIRTRTGVAVRLEAGFSREGYEIWFRFSDSF